LIGESASGAGKRVKSFRLQCVGRLNGKIVYGGENGREQHHHCASKGPL
jgi:hypothetical protein